MNFRDTPVDEWTPADWADWEHQNKLDFMAEVMAPSRLMAAVTVHPMDTRVPGAAAPNRRQRRAAAARAKR